LPSIGRCHSLRYAALAIPFFFLTRPKKKQMFGQGLFGQGPNFVPGNLTVAGSEQIDQNLLVIGDCTVDGTLTAGTIIPIVDTPLLKVDTIEPYTPSNNFIQVNAILQGMHGIDIWDTSSSTVISMDTTGIDAGSLPITCGNLAATGEVITDTVINQSATAAALSIQSIGGSSTVSQALITMSPSTNAHPSMELSTQTGVSPAVNNLTCNLTGNTMGVPLNLGTNTVTCGSVVGSLSIPNGTAGAPGLFFTADPTTGIYRVGSHDFGIACGGVAVADFSTTSGLNVNSFPVTAGSVNAQTLSSTSSVYCGSYSGSQANPNFSKMILDPLTPQVEFFLSTGGTPTTTQIGTTLMTVNTPLTTGSNAFTCGSVVCADITGTSISLSGQDLEEWTLGSPQTISINTPTIVVWDTEYGSQGNITYDNAGNFTLNNAGNYLVTWVSSWGTALASNEWIAANNNISSSFIRFGQINNASGAGPIKSGSTTFLAPANTIVSLYVEQTSSSPNATYSSSTPSLFSRITITRLW